MRRGIVSLLLVLALVLIPAAPSVALSDGDVSPEAVLWSASLTASGTVSSQALGSSVTVKLADDASNLKDDYDAFEPPMPPSPFLRFYFPHDEASADPWPSPFDTTYVEEGKPPATEVVWYGQVQASASSTITLTYNISQIPEGDYAQVEVTVNSVTYDLRTLDPPQVTFAISAWAPKDIQFRIRANEPPAATVTSPNGGEVWTGTHDVTADASDTDGTVASVEFFSSTDGSTWTSIGTDDDGSDGWSVPWDTTTVPDADTNLVRVTATDNNGGTGSDESDAVFTVDNTAPGTPGLLSPDDGSYQTATPVLDWEDVVDNLTGVTYDVQVDDDDLFGSPDVDETGLADSTYTVPGGAALSRALGEAVWYWRARAVDGAGNEGDWSATWSFIVDDTPPPAPTLVFPLDDGYGTAAPTLDWEDVTDVSAVTYRVQLDDDGTFAGPLVDEAGVAGSFFDVPGPLNDGATYYWRVMGTDGAGNVGPWSATWSFTVDVTPPGVPTLTSPADGALINALPTLDWSDVTDLSGVTYDVQVDDDDLFGSPDVDETAVADSFFDVFVELADGDYSWRVKARDGAGNDGDWSAARSFTLDRTAPETPILDMPLDGTITANDTPEFDWGSVTDPSGVSYDFQVDNDPAFGSPEIDETGLVGSVLVVAPLGDDTYSWRARAVDGAGNPSDWTAPWTLQIDTTPPAAPTLLTPADGSATSDTTPTFDWEDVVDASGVTYHLHVVDAEAGVVIHEPLLAGSTFTAAAPLAEDTYSWQVTATDGAGNVGAASATWSFAVDTTPPADAPALVSPDDGTITGDATPTLEWTAVADPSGVEYEIEIDNDSDFSSPEVSKSTRAIPDTSYTLSLAETLPGDTYYWRVRAVDLASNIGPWSAPWSFTVVVTRSTVFPAGWNMFSIPVDPVHVDGHFEDPAVLGDDVSPLFVYWYDPTPPAGYDIYNNNPATSFPATPGMGYWVRVFADTPVDVEGVLVPDAPFVVHLKPGWNMIGAPFAFTTDWNEAQVSDNGGVTMLTIDEAHTAHLIYKYLYWYAGGGYVYSWPGNTSPYPSLTPWYGYWVKALAEVDLYLSPIPAPPPSP